MFRILLGALLFIVYSSIWAQSGSVFGKILDKDGEPLEGATINVSGREDGTVTDEQGKYELLLPAGKYTITITYVGYRTRSVTVNVNQGAYVPLDIRMREETRQLEDVFVTEKREGEIIDTNVTRIDAEAARNLPSAFGDFSKVLVTLPGVASNNEFSSSYSVRGGNFDENLVYVNDIPVYRPFLANAGQQEGLSFVNPEMVSNIRFWAGGWEPKYGDKLSSNLVILYQEPERTQGQMTLGLLGGSATVGTKFNDRFRMIAGVRHRDSRYLLGATEVEGQYFPTYTDFQSLMTFDLTDKESEQKNRTKLHWLVYYGRNRYLTLPESQVTQFGSIQANFRIQTAFDGRESLSYDVYQTGFNLSHLWNETWLTRLIVSGVYTQEREYFDIEGFYRICDVDNNPGTDINDCIIVRGIGTNYNYGRNYLSAFLPSAEIRNEHFWNNQNLLEWGVGFTTTRIDDAIREYAFTDSSDFVQINRSVFNELDLLATNYTAYLQNTTYFSDSIHAFTAGARVNHWSFNNQTLVSPRFLYRFAPNWEKQTIFTFSVGWYQQFPFYRELRDSDGQIRTNSQAQRSIHYIAGMERVLTWWGRPFYLTTEVYYKRLQNLIPYDQENVRLRYLDENDAIGYATGADFRINGEFIPGVQSWFSLGLLSTREDINNDDRGFIRRPTDQRINVAMYFEDHMPNDPSLRIYLNLVYGSGYPTGPPENLQYRNVFNGDAYYRADIGMSKQMKFTASRIKTLWIRLEVLNALGADNTLSYSWIEDINGNQFAVPNSLSARFLNFKVTTEF